MPERFRNRPLLILLLAILFIAVSAIDHARAENTLERLLMPGPVVASHAKVENKCEACHTPFSKATQDNLCLDCHKPIKADIESRTGFHGKSPLVKGVACNLCHDDHKGRDADIVQLDKATFDHAVTDYPLKGAHLDVLCSDCHVAGKRWAEAPGMCFGCHETDQPHRSNLGKECQTCHRDTAWRDTIAFDHARTRFPLRDKHAGVPCISCHLGEVYKGIGMTCNDCHALQDVHRQRFGIACQSCHKETTWKEAKFDHANTRFPLKGAHAKAECKTCHGQNVLERISTACYGCHEKQDVHKAQLGKQCGDCHSDISWREKIVFDHGLTKFPLTGLHVIVACEDCHSSAAFKDGGLACADCHAREDVHAGRFTARCESCHTANGWKRVQFDHGRQTRFPLSGKHASTGCYNCHVRKNVTDASLPANCVSCHAKEDVHRGKFGKDCGRCHGTASFSTAIIKP